MKKSNSELRAELAQAYQRILSLNGSLSECIMSEKDYPAWIHGLDRHSKQDWLEARTSIVGLIHDLVYEDDSAKGGDTVQMPGVIACSEHTLEVVEQLNAAKKELQSILMVLDKIKVEEESDTGRVVMVQLSKRALAALGLARLNRKQTCRKYITVQYPLEYAGFFWSRYVPSVRLTAQQVLDEKLKPLGIENPDELSDQRLQRDYRKIRSLQSNEWLALVNTEVIHRRVNLARVESDNYDHFPMRSQKLAYAPIFYLHDAEFKIPRIRPLPESVHSKDARKKRSDVLIEELPFLLTINVHRYNPPQFKPDEEG